MAVNNLANYTDKDGLGFPLNFRRGNPNPLDNSSVWASLEEAQNYASTSAVAYVGQILTVVDAVNNTATAYCIQDVNGTLERVGTVTLGDDKSIIKNEDNTLSIKGFASAETGAQPRKNSSGEVEWVKPDTTTVEGLQQTVEGLESDISGLRTDVDANTAALEILNGDNTTEGSVAYQVASIIDGAPEAYDTLKEISDWIAKHPEDSSAMNAAIQQNAKDIEALEGLVGTTSVDEQISTAIDEALKIEGADKYALATEQTAIAERVTTAESDVNNIKALVGEKSVAEQISAANTDNEGLNKWATRVHTHIIDNVVGLQDALNAKAASSDLAALVTRVENVEEVKHWHNNKEVLNGITATQVENWNKSNANLIEGITLNGTTAAIENKVVNIPAATASTLGLVKVDDNSIGVLDGTISVKAVGVSKLYVEDDTELVLNGGNA